MQCDKCSNVMKKISTLNSGNALYENYTCLSCNETKMVCVGVNG